MSKLTLITIAFGFFAMACSSMPEMTAPVVVDVRFSMNTDGDTTTMCSGSTVLWGTVLVDEDKCVMESPAITCATFAARVNGGLVGSGAVRKLSGDECGEVYGWFPVGLGVGAHAGDDGAPAGESGDAAPLGATLGDLGLSAD